MGGAESLCCTPCHGWQHACGSYISREGCWSRRTACYCATRLLIDHLLIDHLLIAVPPPEQQIDRCKAAICRNEQGKAEARAENRLQPVHMVWCIQRDFLQGSTTQAAVDAALQQVPNAGQDPSIEQARLHIPGPCQIPPLDARDEDLWRSVKSRRQAQPLMRLRPSLRVLQHVLARAARHDCLARATRLV